MPQLLIVDDEQAMRELLRERLQDTYEIIDTGDRTEALGLALQHKPDCILLDLMLPGFTGFEFCQTLASLSVTRLIPIFVISGKPAAECKEFCLNLGAREYFEKPVDLYQLRARLAQVPKQKPPERRAGVRVLLRLAIELRGTDTDGTRFELLTVTDDVSPSGFLCSCPASLKKDGTVDVFLMGGAERQVGRARVVRAAWQDRPWQQYGFQFVERPRQWILQ